MTEFTSEQELFTIVYLKTDIDCKPRLITAVCFRSREYVTYELSNGDSTVWAVPEEFSEDKPIF